MGDLFALGAQVTVPVRPEGPICGSTIRMAKPDTLRPEEPVGNRCLKLGDAEKPNGEWNTLDLICFNGNSIHIVNGQVMMRLHNAQRLDGSEPAPLTSGQISLQIEGAEVFYRDVEIQPITEVPAEFAGPKM